LFHFHPYIFVSRTILEKGVLVLKKGLVNTKWTVTTQSQTQDDVQNYRNCLLILCLLRAIDAHVTDLSIGQIDHGTGPRAFGGPAQLFPVTTQY